MNIEVLDSTLRDGAQGEGVSFSVADKLHIVEALDNLGIKYIEAGNPGSNPKDAEFFQELKQLKLKNSKVCAFGSTRRKEILASEDANLQSLLAAGTEYVVIFGKSWDMQVTNILQTSLGENLNMIRDSVSYLSSNGKKVIYDAEHFYTGYKENKTYALKTLEAAIQGGAITLCLCETKGGILPLEFSKITEAVCKEYSSQVTIGVHTHNDSGVAVANSLLAVEAGAFHVQGVFLGFGERTGNANLSTIIANLELKMNCHCLPDGKIKELTSTAKKISEIVNQALPPNMPYVGSAAFSHKAGMHIDAVLKNPAAYEHIAPETIGNERVFLMSEVAGRATVIKKLQAIDKSIDKTSPIVASIMAKIKSLELAGYQFDGAEESFELIARRMLGRYKPFYNLHYYETHGVNPRAEDGVCATAQIKLDVDGIVEVTAGEGDGPVNAIDIALRRALSRFYPKLEYVRLTDYKVRVITGSSGTESKVRVLIESTDGKNTWHTVGVSTDVMEASYLALKDSFEYYLIKDIEKYVYK